LVFLILMRSPGLVARTSFFIKLPLISWLFVLSHGFRIDVNWFSIINFTGVGIDFKS